MGRPRLDADPIAPVLRGTAAGGHPATAGVQREHGRPDHREFGSAEQKRKFLPATANLDIWWSQGFSEPEAGSDLAGLRTTARRDGDHYVLNGQKTWTTLGQYGDWMFVLARTDPDAPRKQQGLSFLLLDLNTPGVERRPIRLIDGSAEVNEFFFDDVRLPVENLVGEENKGWSYAKFLLGNERNGIAQIGASSGSTPTSRRLPPGGRPRTARSPGIRSSAPRCTGSRPPCSRWRPPSCG